MRSDEAPSQEELPAGSADPGQEPTRAHEDPPARDVTSSRAVPRSRWRTWGSAGITALGVLGAIAGIVSVVQFATRNTSGFDSLSMQAAPAAGSATSWAVQPGLLADFPASAGGCDDSQRAWLEANADPLELQIAISMVNTAGEGAQISLSRFTATGSGAEQGADVAVLVVCDPAPGASLPSQFARLDVGSPDGAVYARPVAEGETPVGDVPLVWNLAPGEAGTATVNLYSDGAASGTLSVAVTSRGETREIAIEGSDFSIPALLMGGEVAMYADADGLRCEQLLHSVIVPCTLEGVLAAVDGA